MEKAHKILKLLIIALVIVIVAVVAGAYMMTHDLGEQQELQDPAAAVPYIQEINAGATEAAPTAAPDFTVYDIDGNPVKLSDFWGKPVILNFWATWCGPCKAEMPALQDAYEEYGDAIQFLVVDIADGKNDTAEAASTYIAEQGYTFPSYYDTALEAAYTYGISGIPATYFIDSEGYFVTRQLGSMTESILKQGIDMLLKTE